MRTIDLSPLYRSFIGSDRLANLVDSANRNSSQTGFPLYNIELHEENKYSVTLALAGYKKEDLTIEVKENSLTVSGKVSSSEEDKKSAKFLHKGISQTDFERKFQLGDHVKVSSADFVDGLLTISLERVIPEALKPKSIEIGSKLLNS